MRARDLIGKTIADVRQRRFTRSSGRPGWTVDELVCTDGTIIRPLAMETEDGDGYGIDMIIVEPAKAQP